MKVHELRTILDHVPDDLDVHVVGGQCHHIHHVTRWTTASGLGPNLSLSAFHWGRPCDPADYDLTGPFRRRHELLVALDPEVPVGEPA